MARKKAKGITKSEILDAGLKLITSKGPEVTVQEIATAADVSRQMVYQYFGTRGGLLMALVVRLDEEYGVKGNFFKAMELEDPKNRLTECLKVWLKYASEILPIASEFNRLRYTDADAAAAWNDRMRDLHSWIRELVLTFKAEKSLKQDWNTQSATDFIFATTSIQLYEILTVDRKWNRKKTVKTISEYLGQSMLKSE